MENRRSWFGAVVHLACFAVAMAMIFGGHVAAAASSVTKCVDPTKPTTCSSTIQAALNASPKNKNVTIDIAAGTYNEKLTIPPGKTISLVGAGGLPTGDPTQTIISGSGISAPGSVISGAKGAAALVLSTLTVTGGSTPLGGAISGSNNLSIVNSIISGNAATGAPSGTNLGGGIYFTGKSLKIAQTNITGNSSDIGGGLYLASGRVNIQSSQLASNIAKDAAGGIALSGGSAQLTNVSLILNQATLGNGGAIRVNGGKLNAGNATIVNNLAGQNAGGIEVIKPGSALLNNSTVAGNIAGDAGGLLNSSPSKEALKISNSLIAGNGGLTSPNPDCSGTIASLGFNLIQESSAACNLIGQVKTDITGKNAGLPTPPLSLSILCNKTDPAASLACALPISALSPVIDSGNPANPNGIANHCLPADPLSTERPKGKCDIGSYQLP